MPKRDFCRLTALLLFAAISCIKGYSQEQSDSLKLIHADVTRIDNKLDPDIVQFCGNVVMYHDSVTMFCDTAYYNEREQWVDAWGNIRIHRDRGNEKMQGSFLRYDGNTRLAEIWGNVEAWNDQARLTTEQLFYNMAEEEIYYNTGGKLVHGNDTLTSREGKFFTIDEYAWFHGNVRVVNNSYQMLTDTLNYDTKSAISEFFGPSILSRLIEKDTLLCTGGWFNSRDSIAFFHTDVDVRTGSYHLTGDSLFYSTRDSSGYARSNVVFTDTARRVVGKSHLARFRLNPEQMLMTERALMIYYEAADSFFLHADTIRTDMEQIRIARKPLRKPLPEIDTKATPPDSTITLKLPPDSTLQREPSDSLLRVQPPDSLRSVQLPPTLQQTPLFDTLQLALLPDSLRKSLLPDTLQQALPPDSTGTSLARQPLLPDSLAPVRRLNAYGRVKFFREDVQGACDSLTFFFGDSIGKMFGTPILWSEMRQATSDSMLFFIKNGKIHRFEFLGRAMAVMQDDPIYFNQLQGGKMEGFFDDSTRLTRMVVTMSAASIYFPKDNNALIGGNKVGSDTITILLKDQKAEIIRFTPGSEGTLIPIQKFSPANTQLEGFKWFFMQRPRKPEEVFEWFKE